MADTATYRNLYEYLDSLPGIESFGQDEYREAKKFYWNVVYKRRQRQTRKNTHRTCSFSCTTDEREKLQGCAKTHGLSVSQYVKQASLTYGSGGSIPMRNDGINHLLEHVIDVKNFVHRIRTFPIEAHGELLKSLDKVIRTLIKLR